MGWSQKERGEELPDGNSYRSITGTNSLIFCHREPFNCCAKTAASGKHGSSIGPVLFPEEMIPTSGFEPGKV